MDGQTGVRHRHSVQLDSGRIHDSDHQQPGMGRSHYLQSHWEHQEIGYVDFHHFIKQLGNVTFL